jgi:tryptophan 2,3-dioxygenase
MPHDDRPYYGSYLRVDDLLRLQVPLSRGADGRPAHDEMLFIVVHQAYELWFRQILHELDEAARLLSGEAVEERRLGQATQHVERVVAIWRLLVQQVEVLETMTPLDFLDFRDALIPASGFQSVQFRLIENRLGLPESVRLRVDAAPYHARLSPEDRERLESARSQPSLFDLVEAWLVRTPFVAEGAASTSAGQEGGGFAFWQAYREAVGRVVQGERRAVEATPGLSEEDRAREAARITRTEAHFAALFEPEQYQALREEGAFRLEHRAFLAALLIHLYRDEPLLHLPFRLLTALVDVDELITTWRFRHAQMVLRMIGGKIGTGGSSGHEYLRRTADAHRVFGDLVKLSGFLIPRSALPALPQEVKAQLDFRLG